MQANATHGLVELGTEPVSERTHSLEKEGDSEYVDVLLNEREEVSSQDASQVELSFILEIEREAGSHALREYRR